MTQAFAAGRKRDAMRVAGAFLVLTGLSLDAGPANAQVPPRPDSLKMTCAQTAALVRSRGAIIIGTGPYIFDRFVADRRFCSITEATQAAFVKTRDTPNCFLGYLCKPVQDVWPWDW